MVPFKYLDILGKITSWGQLYLGTRKKRSSWWFQHALKRYAVLAWDLGLEHDLWVGFPIKNVGGVLLHGRVEQDYFLLLKKPTSSSDSKWWFLYPLTEIIFWCSGSEGTLCRSRTGYYEVNILIRAWIINVRRSLRLNELDVHIIR